LILLVRGNLLSFLTYRHRTEQRFHDAHEGIFAGLWELIKERMPEGLEEEALFNGELQSSRFLYEGFKASRFIGKIHLQNGGQGTGTMVSKRLLLTASHVFKTCKKGEVAFESIDPHSNVYQRPKEIIFKLEPETFFLAHPDASLDVAFIAVSERSVDGNVSLRNIGHCERAIRSEKPGTHVNIIQFPRNSNQMVVLRQNQILHSHDRRLQLFDKAFVEHHRYKMHRSAAKKRSWFKKADREFNLPFLRYTADTDSGASGSPCFDDMWNLIGIHQCALSVERKSGGFKYVANEGVKIGTVIDWVKEEIDNDEREGFRALLEGFPLDC